MKAHSNPHDQALPPPLPGTSIGSRVLLLESHPIVRLGLTELMKRATDLAVCDTAAEPSTALDRIQAEHPDVVLLADPFHGRDALQLLSQIRAQFPEQRVIVFSAREERLYAARCLRAGASAYVLKKDEPCLLMTALRRVLQGGRYVSQALQSGDDDLVESLTSRERTVLRLIGEGKSNLLIAHQLGLQVKTIARYRTTLKQKLHLKCAAQLKQQARDLLHEETAAA